MAILNAQTVSRLKGQLLTSGLQQKDQPLFQVINQLIDSLGSIGQEVQTFTGGGGGGGGASANADFVTHQDNQASLPNSRVIVPGSGVTIHKGPKELLIGASPIPGMEGWDEPEISIPLPGPQGVRGLTGPMGPPGLDAYCECPMGALLGPGGLEYLGTWITYVPVWTAQTSDPALGNGTLEGRYMRLGHTIFFRVVLTIGSTTTFGSNFWKFTMPTTAKDLNFVATCLARAAAGSITVGYTIPLSTTQFAIGSIATTALASVGAWQSTFPFNPPVTGDIFVGYGFYEEP